MLRLIAENLGRILIELKLSFVPKEISTLNEEKVWKNFIQGKNLMKFEVI